MLKFREDKHETCSFLKTAKLSMDFAKIKLQEIELLKKVIMQFCAS